jgi:hypothetical protein|tara:strand:+ start:2769 stop:3632 length:864 start_codon:yes stop_codon:yes gene_type:complete
MATILALSPITTFVRDVIITTVVMVNQRMRWIICGSGRSGVTTLQAAFQTSSDIIPDLPSTEEKTNARVIRAKMDGPHYRFRAADMMNQPPGRWQYLEEIVSKPVGIVFVFKTFRLEGGKPVMDEHLLDNKEFKRTPEGHLRHEADYQQFRFLSNAFLYPDTLEKNYPGVFEDSSLHSDIRYRYLNHFKGHAPAVVIMAGNFLDLTFPMEEIASPVQYEYQMREFLRPYMESFQPLTDQWQRFQRKGWFGGKKPPCAVRYCGISAKYNIGVKQLLNTMHNSIGILGG